MLIITSLSHHATLFVHPDRKEFAETLWQELQPLSPAHVFHNHTVIDIDTARSLIAWANTPYDSKRFALISFHTITVPAQNALLKILEEPQPQSSFILVTTNKEAIIPTLYSRLQHRTLPSSFSSRDTAALFLKIPSRERMKLPCVTELLETKDEEGRKDREAIRMFILTLVEILSINPLHQDVTQATLEIASYASDPSSSGKSLLEYLSLLLPEINV